MKINFRKISAAAASLIITGMSAGFAAAANYPAPFVEAGVANVAIVSGSGTGVSALDAVEAGNIQANLNLGITSTTSTISGDAKQLDKTSDHINIGDALNGPFGSTVDDSDLDLLADGVYVADDSDTFDYEQRVTLGGPELTHFRDSDYESLIGASDKTPTIGINITSNQFIMNYTIDFLDDAESDVVSSELNDLEGSFLPLFGKSFYVSDWDNGTVAGVTGKLTLLDSGAKGVVKEGEVTTIPLGANSYDIAIDYIDADSTALSVNGFITSDLKEGETEKLADGTFVGVTDVRRLEVGGEIGTVEFSLGSGKLELEHNTEIQLNDDTVSDVRSYLQHGAGGSGTAKVDKIVIEWKSDADSFITPKSELTLPGMGGLKFSMTEFVRPTEELIKVQNDGSDTVELRVPIKDGNAAINLLYANKTVSNYFGIGEASDKRLATSPTGRMTFWEKKDNADYHAYFVASFNDSDNGESYLLDLRPRADTGNNRNETDVYNVVTGEMEATDKIAADQVTVGDVSFTIETVYVNATDEYVNITAGSNTVFNTVYSTGGLRIYLPWYAGGTGMGANQLHLSEIDGAQNDSASLHGLFTNEPTNAIGALGNGSAQAGHNNVTWYLTMDDEDKDDNIAGGSAFEVRLEFNTDSKVEIDQVNTSGVFAASGGTWGIEQASTDAYETYVRDDVATKLVHFTNPDQDYVEIYYPTAASQSYAKVFLTDITATSVPEGGAVLVKDTEVSSVATKNLIIVGGSCINSAAATLVGGAFCGSAWTDATSAGSGQFVVKAYPDSTLTSALAMLVAGYEAADTQAASTYVRTQTFDTSAVAYTGPVVGV